MTGVTTGSAGRGVKEGMRSAAIACFLSLSLSACGAAPPAPGTPATGGGESPASAGSAEGGPSTAAAESGGGTTVSFRLPEVGGTRVDREAFELVMDISEISGGKVLRSEHTVEQRSAVEHSTVLATDGKAITKKKVRVEKDEMVKSQGERTQKSPSPLTGKTYVLSIVNGKLAVAREGGEPVSELEIERLSAKNQNFGKPPRFADFVPPGPLTPGQTFKPSSSALGEMFGGGGKEFGDVEFRFEGEEQGPGGRLARFTFRALIIEKTGVKIATKGHAVLRVDSGWPTELEVNGDLVLDTAGDAPGTKISGRGKMKMKLAAEYR